MKNFNDFLKWEQISRDSIDVKRIYIDIAGDLVTGILLSQIIYWHLPSGKDKSKLTIFRNGKKWLAKKREDWWDECRISPKQFDRSIAILKKLGLVEVSTFKFNGNPTKHLYLCKQKLLERVNSFFTKGEEPTLPKVKNDIDQRGSSYINVSKTTSEITTEKKTPPIAPQGASEKTSYALVSKRDKGNTEIDPPREIPISDLDYESPPKNKPSKITPPPWMNQKDWQDLLEIRRKAKAVNTPRALKVYIKELDKAHQHGWTSENLVDEIAAHGWRGFKHEWLERAQRQKPKMDPRHDPSSPEFMPD